MFEYSLTYIFEPSVGMPLTVLVVPVPWDAPYMSLRPSDFPTYRKYWLAPVLFHLNVTDDEVNLLPFAGLLRRFAKFSIPAMLWAHPISNNDKKREPSHERNSVPISRATSGRVLDRRPQNGRLQNSGRGRTSILPGRHNSQISRRKAPPGRKRFRMGPRRRRGRPP